MITPLTLGNKTFPVNIIQGPLAGISCAPFRLLTWQYSQPAFSCTEMISCKTLIHQPLFAKQRYIQKDPQEGPVCFQLSGNDENELAQAVQLATEYGADLIDLNCGCPVKKIRAKGAGSSLLAQPQKLHTLIRAMKDNTHLPVSIKIRVDGKSNDKNNQELINILRDSGLDYLIVHGRHWTEHYETACQHEQIAYFAQSLSIPVIGNGDIACVKSLKQMFATGCSGVMIGRAGVGQPWLIAKLIAEMQNQPFTIPTYHEMRIAFLSHVQQLIQLLNNEKFAILQARAFAKYYARSLKTKPQFAAAVNTCENYLDLEKICREYFAE